ncbi:MAG: lyase family protein, partial [Desulfuromonadaceae bacterium]
MAQNQLWGGRFTQPTDQFVQEFTASIDFDKRMYRYDIQGSMAHARMLAKQGIIADAEAQAIIEGLEAILADIEAGNFEFSVALEDIHMNVEKRLIERIGPVGGKLHTARSRNDQVALDVRLYLRDELKTILAYLDKLQGA